MPPRPERTDIWREGKYLDLWSVVHLLSGASLALGLTLLHLPALPACGVALVLFIAYELWEPAVGIKETTQNHVVDVVVGMISFVPAYLYLAPALQGIEYVLTFGAILIVNLVMAAAGWHAWRKATSSMRRH